MINDMHILPNSYANHLAKSIGLIIAGVGSRGTGQRRNIGVVASDSYWAHEILAVAFVVLLLNVVHNTCLVVEGLEGTSRLLRPLAPNKARRAKTVVIWIKTLLPHTKSRY